MANKLQFHQDLKNSKIRKFQSGCLQTFVSRFRKTMSCSHPMHIFLAAFEVVSRDTRSKKAAMA